VLPRNNCIDACPTGALKRSDGVVRLSTDDCISYMKCAESCPFGAIYAHGDVEYPIKCDLCGGEPECARICPKRAIRFVPEQALGESKRLSNILSYAHMKEIEFQEEGQKKIIRYAEIGKEELGG
jgi:Fe-S-cluster-containing hydrogenase component 2